MGSQWILCHWRFNLQQDEASLHTASFLFIFYFFGGRCRQQSLNTPTSSPLLPSPPPSLIISKLTPMTPETRRKCLFPALMQQDAQRGPSLPGALTLVWIWFLIRSNDHHVDHVTFMSPMTVWKSPPSALHSLSITVSIFSGVLGYHRRSLGAPEIHKWGGSKQINEEEEEEKKKCSVLVRTLGLELQGFPGWRRAGGGQEQQQEPAVSLLSERVNPCCSGEARSDSRRRQENFTDTELLCADQGGRGRAGRGGSAHLVAPPPADFY